VGALLLGAVSACSSGRHSIAAKTYRGFPVDRPAVAAPPAGAVATVSNGRLALTFWGSGSCPTVPTRLDVVDTGTIDVALSRTYDHDCDGDLGPTTSELRIDSRKVVLDSHLIIRLTGAGFPPGQLVRLTGG
jgi:hypothetical protein